MILITGATGFVGQRLLQDENRALVRKRSGLVNEIIGDLLDPASLSTACKGISTVFHCAGYAHSNTRSNTDAYWQINFEGTRNLLTAAGQAGVKRFVFLSSVKAMAEPGDNCIAEDWPGEPTTPYGKSKRAAEDAVLDAGHKYGMHVVNLRLAMVYGRGGRGNLQRMATAIRTGWFPPLPEDENMRSLVHVDDVVEAIRLVVEKPEANGRTYIVSDYRPYSGRKIYDEIRSALGMSSIHWHVPYSLFRVGGRIGDWLETFLNNTMPWNSKTVSRLLDSECYSPRLIEQELGWRAQIGLAEGLREMLRDEAPD